MIKCIKSKLYNIEYDQMEPKDSLALTSKPLVTCVPGQLGSLPRRSRQKSLLDQRFIGNLTFEDINYSHVQLTRISTNKYGST